MCLYFRKGMPKVAKRHIICLKYLRREDDRYFSPCQGTPVTLNEKMVATPSKPQEAYELTDDYGNEVRSLNGGVIHAKLLKNSGYGNCCVKAIIPKGTKYWVDPFGTEIAAKEMIVTSEKGSDAVLDDSFAKDILEDAPEVNGIRVGDYLLESGNYAHPSKRVKKAVGIVAGFNPDGEPLIAALDRFYEQWGAYDVLDKTYSVSEACKLFNGREVTQKAKEKLYNYPAFKVCVEYGNEGDEWYMPALGEMTTMLNNAIYLNAAHTITDLGFAITTQYWFWSCSEDDSRGSLGCGLGRDRVGCGWRYKDCRRRIVPFLASTGHCQKETKKISLIKRLWQKLT